MLQKLHILVSYWDAAYWTLVSALQKKQSDLNSAGILYNPQYMPYWQVWSHEPLCSQLKEYLFAKINHKSDYLAIVDNIVMDSMQKLEEDAASGKDVLCFLGSVNPDSVPFLAEYINKFTILKKLRPTFTAILGRQDGELRNQLLRHFKRMDAQDRVAIQIEHDANHRANALYDNFERWCGRENCRLMTHDSADPHTADADAIKELLAHFGVNNHEEEELPTVCFPRSYPGIDLACTLQPFSFSVPTRKDQNGFYARLREVERDHGYEEALFMPKKEAAALLERCREGNGRLARMLGRPCLFAHPHPLDALPDAPEVLPDITAQQCATFIKALDAEIKDFFLRRLRDLERALTPKEQQLGSCLEEDRAARKRLSPFVFPRRTPAVTVLTLCYNHEKYILDCMRGVTAQQTDFPVEHVIVDDGSADGSAAIIDDYASRHSHVRPIFRPFTSTCGENVHTLFDMARTEYVALCDGDDYFSDPAKLQTQVDFLKAHKDCALCFHPVRVLYEGDPDTERVYPPVEELPRGLRPFYYAGDLARANFIQTNSVMYRWRFQDGLPDWFHPDLIQGDWYWHMLHAETGKIGFINTVMSVYRRHAGALWRLSEIDRQEHRYKVGLGELRSYHIMNEHHKGKYSEHFLRLGDGVIADILRYARKVGDGEIIDEINEKYPQFAHHFMETLAAMKKNTP